MRVCGICLAILPFLSVNSYASAILVDLGTAAPFAVLAGSAVTNTGATNILGSVGVWAGSSIGGFPPGIVTGGTFHAGDAVAMNAQNDLTTAYNAAAAQPCGVSLTGMDLGSVGALTSGVYCFASTAQLTGTLTLDFQGNSNSVFVFQIGSALTTASASSVVFVNGGSGNNVFWQVGSSATLGTTTEFTGSILALTSVTLDTGANIDCGRALARNGAVTLDGNRVSVGGCAAGTGGEVPEPGSAMLFGIGGVIGLAFYGWRWRFRLLRP